MPERYEWETDEQYKARVEDWEKEEARVEAIQDLIDAGIAYDKHGGG